MKLYSAATAMTRPLSFLILGAATLTGCFLGVSEEQRAPEIEHSPGFFAEFDAMVDEATAAESDELAARRLREGFADALERGVGPDETVALGSTWTKVETFLEIGLATAAVMESVEDAPPNRVAMYGVAADRILRCDFRALEAHNREVREMGLPELEVQRTGRLPREAFDLVLAESEHAVVQRWIESGEWVEGHYERREGHYEDVWVDGYWDTVWQEGGCWDEYVGDDCVDYWVDGACYDVYVEDGYYETVCDAYDEWGNCLSWSERWVDAGWWDVVCEEGSWAQDCVGVYQTVCEEGGWVDVWVEGYWTQGPWIPGEDVWVEGYWRDTSGWEDVVLLDQEAEILAAGVEVILANGAETLDELCLSGLDDAMTSAEQAAPEVASAVLRSAIMRCLSGD